jgi:hypothetical protein
MTDQPPVIGLEQRRLSELHELYQDLRDYPAYGVLAAFVTTDDPHSPLVLQYYDELVSDHLSDAVPFHVIDAATLDSETLEKLLVFSAPTLIWFRLPEGQTEPKTLFRIVGTVTYQKLQHEADKVLDELIDD